MKTKNCPISGAGALKKEVGTESLEYKVETNANPKYVTYVCSECGEDMDPLTGSDLCKLSILQEERFARGGLFALELHFGA